MQLQRQYTQDREVLAILEVFYRMFPSKYDALRVQESRESVVTIENVQPIRK